MRGGGRCRRDSWQALTRRHGSWREGGNQAGSACILLPWVLYCEYSTGFIY